MTLEESPRILLDKVSYLFEQQFSVKLIAGNVAVMDDATGRYDPEQPWAHGDAGIIRFDTSGRGNSPLRALCSSGEMLGTDGDVFTADGQFRCHEAKTLLHEMGHFFRQPPYSSV
jgi:hypothetical protein